MIAISEADEHRGDLGDVAAGHAAMAADLAIMHARHAAGQPVPSSPACLNCGTPTQGGARWCDADCRDDWMLREKQGRGRAC